MIVFFLARLEKIYHAVQDITRAKENITFSIITIERDSENVRPHRGLEKMKEHGYEITNKMQNLVALSVTSRYSVLISD